MWFLRRIFLISSSSLYFLLFLNYAPLAFGMTLHLNKFELSLPKDALCQVWWKLARRFWRTRWKYEKFTDGQTDGRRTTGDQRSFSKKTVMIISRFWIAQIFPNLKFCVQWLFTFNVNDVDVHVRSIVRGKGRGQKVRRGRAVGKKNDILF